VRCHLKTQWKQTVGNQKLGRGWKTRRGTPGAKRGGGKKGEKNKIKQPGKGRGDFPGRAKTAPRENIDLSALKRKMRGAKAQKGEKKLLRSTKKSLKLRDPGLPEGGQKC